MPKPAAPAVPADLVASLPDDASIEANVPLDSLKRHPRNPRKGNRDKIRKSIEQHGFADVVIAQKATRHIIAGWHRSSVAAELGYTHAPVVIWRDVDDDEALRQVLDYNKASDESEYDLNLLRDVLVDLDRTTAGLDATLYTGDELLDLRRITGDLAESASDFLSGIDTPDLSAAAAAARADGRDSALTLQFALTTSQRERVMRAVNKIKSEHGVEHSGDALDRLAAHYLGE